MPFDYKTDRSMTLKTRPNRKLRCGFKSPNQLPFFMLWEEIWYNGEVVHANCLYVQDGLEP